MREGRLFDIHSCMIIEPSSSWGLRFVYKPLFFRLLGEASLLFRAGAVLVYLFLFSFLVRTKAKTHSRNARTGSGATGSGKIKWNEVHRLFYGSTGAVPFPVPACSCD